MINNSGVKGRSQVSGKHPQAKKELERNFGEIASLIAAVNLNKF